MTVIEGVVAPVLQVPPFIFPESVTLPPIQNVNAPLAVMTGTMGRMATSTTLPSKLIAPAVVRPLPISVAPCNKLIAPFDTIVPLKEEVMPNEVAPSTCQYTLHKEAPLMSVTLESEAVDKAPPILKINTALVLPPASKIKLPVKVEAAPVQ